MSEDNLKKLFQKKWENLYEYLDQNKGCKFPGVYILAYTPKDLKKDEKIKHKDVFYVGMSNSQGGVNQRLREFKRAIEGKGSHSGGNRFYREWMKGKPFSQHKGKEKFFVAMVTIPCNVHKNKTKKNSKTRTPKDLRKMGEVAKLEYDVLSDVLKKTGKEPDLNEK